MKYRGQSPHTEPASYSAVANIPLIGGLWILINKIAGNAYERIYGEAETVKLRRQANITVRETHRRLQEANKQLANLQAEYKSLKVKNSADEEVIKNLEKRNLGLPLTIGGELTSLESIYIDQITAYKTQIGSQLGKIGSLEKELATQKTELASKSKAYEEQISKLNLTVASQKEISNDLKSRLWGLVNEYKVTLEDNKLRVLGAIVASARAYMDEETAKELNINRGVWNENKLLRNQLKVQSNGKFIQLPPEREEPLDYSLNPRKNEQYTLNDNHVLEIK